jgi:hypothetical protein
MTGIIAWLVIEAHGNAAAFTDQAAATDYCVRQHGILEPLVMERDVAAMIAAAFEAGARRAFQHRDESLRHS